MLARPANTITTVAYHGQLMRRSLSTSALGRFSSGLHNADENVAMAKIVVSDGVQSSRQVTW